MIKKRAFVTYLFSYILVLIIPITTISYFMYFKFIGQFQEEIMNSATKTLELTRDTINKHIESFAGLTSNLSTNPHILYLLSKDDVEKVETYPYILNAIKELSKYKNANSIIENIFIIFKNQNVVIGDLSKYDVGTFTKRVFKLSDAKSTDFMHMLNDIKGEVILPLKNVTYKERQTDLILYIQSLPVNDVLPKATLVMVVDEDSFIRSMDNYLKDYRGYACIFDQDNNLIMSTEFGDFKLSEEERDILLSQIEDKREDSYSITKYGYVISFVRSQKNNWKYISFIPSTNILSKVRFIRIRMVEIIVLSMVIGLLVILYLSKKDYRRINKIISSLKIHEEDLAIEDNNINEWDMINEAIVKYISKNEALQERIYQQIPLMKNSFFSRLINGRITDEKDVEETLDLLGLKLNKKYYGVFIIETAVKEKVGNVSSIKIEDGSHENTKLIREVIQATLTDIVQKVAGKDCFIYALQDQKHTLDVIIGMGDENIDNEDIEYYSKYLQQITSNIKDHVKRDLGFTVAIGIGSLYRSLINLDESYAEALEALEYKMLMGYDSIISYDTVSNRGNKRVFYSFNQERELVNYLRMGEYEEIQKILDEIVFTIKSEPINLESVKYIYFDIINTAMKAADEINIESSNIEAFMEELNRMETIDEIYNSVSDFYRKLCAQINEIKKSKSTELRDKVIEYINQNYMDSMLSVEGIARHFSVSPSYLSHYMKEHLGCSITDYIHEVRLQRAKWLLLNTNKTVATIAEEVGYNSLHNFSRVFKRYERITPTDYRTYS